MVAAALTATYTAETPLMEPCAGACRTVSQSTEQHAEILTNVTQTMGDARMGVLTRMEATTAGVAVVCVWDSTTWSVKM